MTSRNICYWLLAKTGNVMLFAVLLGIVASCGKKPEAEVVKVPRPVKIVELQGGGLKTVISLPGQIMAGRQADMAFEVSGQMIEMKVEEGQLVEAGQLLAKLDSRDYEALRDGAKAQLENAESEAIRAQALFDKQATSKQRLDTALSSKIVAKSTFDRAQKAYEDTSLKAPFSGVIAKIFVDDIVNVTAKEKILILQDNTHLKMTVDVPETLGILSKPGVSLEERSRRANPMIYLTARPDRAFPATIIELASSANPTTRTYEGTLLFDNPKDISVFPGMTAKVNVTFPSNIETRPNEFVLPGKAVISDESGNSFVWMVSQAEMTVRRQAVKIGSLGDGNIEVISEELKQGDWVAVSGVHKLHEGDQVRKFVR